ncbi:MAG: gamma-glutamyl-gamma-aminobutyrate hydrolase family protein [Nitrospinae bacterium]|nr:gamma-glutamyl-gamma-aminobutyrate hydrolase family protein [Nitrospinota bacterium]
MKTSSNPLIGVTIDVEPRTGDDGQTSEYYSLKRPYADAVAKAGGVPIFIPPQPDARGASRYLRLIHGLVISGGPVDVDPKFYGEKPHPKLGALKPERTASELMLVKRAVKMGMPALGICGGEQVINVAFGGALYQDIPSQFASNLAHDQDPLPSTKPSHKVRLQPKTMLHRVTRSDETMVNSTHHQAVKTLGKSLKVCAVSPDGLVEAIEGVNAPYLLGVQWHPERLYDDDSVSRSIFASFIKAARGYARRR